MDPNAARERMIEKANEVLAGDLARSDIASDYPAAATELAEAVHDLDEWLRSGGFLPDLWLAPTDLAGKVFGHQPGRKQSLT